MIKKVTDFIYKFKLIVIDGDYEEKYNIEKKFETDFFVDIRNVSGMYQIGSDEDAEFSMIIDGSDYIVKGELIDILHIWLSIKNDGK